MWVEIVPTQERRGSKYVSGAWVLGRGREGRTSIGQVVRRSKWGGAKYGRYLSLV